MMLIYKHAILDKSRFSYLFIDTAMEKYTVDIDKVLDDFEETEGSCTFFFF